LEEAVEDEPDEEGLVAALPRLMDVRPLGPAPEAARPHE
jgi:hypothetical protein